MTRAARIATLAFEDFAPRAQTPEVRTASIADEPPPARFTQAEIDAAFAQGHAAGHAAGCQESTHAAEAAMAMRLAQLAASLAEDQARRSDAIEERLTALRAPLRLFLDSFCRRLAADRAAPLALSLVERLLAASADRAPATLFVSGETFTAYGDRLRAELAARGADFIDIACDDALDPGECRLQWRGGAASWSHESATAEIDRILDAAAAETAEKRP